MPAFSRTCLVLFCWIHSVRQSSANPGQLVEPRKLAVLADGEGGDWNTGRRLCRSVNMTLATVDRHVVSFLLQQTHHAKFQRYPHQQFWIGMYHEEGSPGSRGKYRWEADCAEVLSGSLWASGQPVDSDDLLCVLADHLTLRWKTADCRVRQNFLCQRKEDACSYQRTLPTCTLYITASFRFSLPGGTPQECEELCNTSLKGSLPCWGFTLTGEGCVLHYQAAQPPCDIHHLHSSAYFRTCFNIFYVDGPFNRNPSNSSLPQVPHCSTSTQLASARNLSDPRLYTTELPSEANLSPTTSEPRYITTPNTSSLLPSATQQPNTTTATTSASSPSAMMSSIMTSATTAQTTLSPSVSAVFPPVATAQTTLSPSVSAVFPPVAPSTSTLSPSVSAVFPPVAPSTSTLSPSVSAVFPPVATAQTTLSPSVSAVFPPVAPSTSTLSPSVSAVFPPVALSASPLPPSVSAVFPPVAPSASPLPPSVSAVFPPVAPSASPLPPSVSAVFPPVAPSASPLPPSVSAVFPPVAPSASPLPPSVSAVFPPVAPSASPKSSIAHLCWCKCDISRRNKTVVLEEAEVTKRKLKIDVTTLSSTRRKKCSAEDNRVSSKGIAYIGISFVAVIAAWIVLPDIVSVTYHVWYGVPRNWTKLSKPASVRVH